MRAEAGGGLRLQTAHSLQTAPLQTARSLQTARLLQKRAEPARQAIRIRLRDRTALKVILRHLEGGGQGSVSLLFRKPQYRCEVEIALPDKYRISPEMILALQKITGVIEVIQEI